MNEQHLGIRIRSALDAGLRLAPEVAARLSVARERALERHHVADRGFAAATWDRAGAVPRDPGQATLRRPPAVAVHDDRDVARRRDRTAATGRHLRAGLAGQ